MAGVLKKNTYFKKFIYLNPNASPDEILAAAERVGMTKLPSKKAIQDLRYKIKKKLNIKSLNDIPRKNGAIDLVGLVKLLIKKNPKISQNIAKDYLALDGFVLSTPIWEEAKSEMKDIEEISSKKTNSYLEMEEQLDSLVLKAIQLGNQEILESLRKARRKVTVQAFNK